MGGVQPWKHLNFIPSPPLFARYVNSFIPVANLDYMDNHNSIESMLVQVFFIMNAAINPP